MSTHGWQSGAEILSPFYRKILLCRLEMDMRPASSEQRRQHPRIEVKWPVTMMTPEGDMDGTIENISLGGAYIRCGTPLCKKDLFILSIMAQDREDSWIGAEVIWLDIPGNADAGSVPVGMGVRFTNISADDHEFINDAVAENVS